MYSYGPTCDDADDVVRLELENDLEPPSAKGSAGQLVAVTKSPVPSNLKVRKEALDSLAEGDSMGMELVAAEIVLEVRGRESMPIDQSSLYCGSPSARPAGLLVF